MPFSLFRESKKISESRHLHSQTTTCKILLLSGRIHFKYNDPQILRQDKNREEHESSLPCSSLGVVLGISLHSFPKQQTRQR
jgi:hypothetical protein